MALRWRVEEALAARVRAPLVPQLRGHLQVAEGMALLDVGGGTGWMAAQLAAQATVVEPHAGKRRHGARAHPGLTFVDARAEALPFPDASFDRVLFLVSLHHIADQPQALREARRVLRPGGRAAVFEMDARQRGPRWIHALPVRLGHAIHLLDPDELASLLRAAGFADVRTERAPRGYLASARA
ncbi:MAG TPA: methyltransferase domain-containing protein [Candidatus Thermoplasmatota archaeon]|jgi:SAM-dependent methyltransferase|nr:methyltransferase domain-containing protein [Candidatus Thermoplasmatota archaeon]